MLTTQKNDISENFNRLPSQIEFRQLIYQLINHTYRLQLLSQLLFRLADDETYKSTEWLEKFKKYRFYTVQTPSFSLKFQYCYYCPSLTSIPQLDRLILLNCAYCPLLLSIPQLTELSCNNCQQLAEINGCARIRTLCPDNCPILYLPHQVRIKYGIKPKFMINKIRYHQIKIRKMYRYMVASIILRNTSFYDALASIIAD